MSATISPADAVISTDAEFATIVANYAKSEELPSAAWLTRLELEQSQTHLRSIDLWTQRAKRALDLFCAVGMLVLLAPVMLLRWVCDCSNSNRVNQAADGSSSDFA